MTWVPAMAIGGALLALGPILIHILFRRRYRLIDFAAMRFLFESLRRNKQRLRVEELIIIALRVLGCLLIGFTLANVRSATPFAGTAAATAHVFILDDSLSMGQQIGATTLFQKALTLLTSRLDNLPDGDRVAVISGARPRSGEPLGKLVPAMDIKRDHFTGRLAASRPTDLDLDLAGALRAAEKLLAASAEPIPARLYVISDFRQRDLTGAEESEQLRKAFAAFNPKTTELILLDFGRPCRNNLALERVTLGRKLVVSGVNVPIRVTVRNTGTLASEPTQVEARIGEVCLPSLPVPALVPGESTDVDFRYTFSPPGFAAVEARLPADGLPGDSASTLAFEVRESVRILIVDGSPNPQDPKSASFCLAHALDPSGKGAFAQGVDVRQAETWQATSLDLYDLAILANVRDFPAAADKTGKTVYPHVQALEEYVRAGGGLGIFLGPNVGSDFYNGPLFANGRGLCPARLSLQAPPAPDPEKYVRLSPQSVGAEPMLRIFTGRSERFSRLIRFYTFMRLDELSRVSSDAAGPVSVLARFDDEAGSPLAVKRPCGRGTVILWTTAADPLWSNWPKDLSFLPVMNDMAWDLVRPARNEFTDAVGRRLSYALPGRLQEATSVLLKTPAYPAEDVVALPIHHDGQQKIVEYADARHAGVYEMSFSLPDRTEQKVFFARSVEPKESDLSKATEAQIRAAVDRPYQYVADLAVRDAAREEETPRKAFWWVFMVALLAVMGLESFLAQKFGHYQPRVRSALDPASLTGAET